MKNNQLIVGLLIIVFTVTGFFGGMKYQETKSVSQRQFGNGNAQNRTGMASQNGNRTGGPAGMGGRNGGQITGEVSNSDDKSITVRMTDGSSKIILLSSTTTIIKSTEASKIDLIVGTKVGVFGQINTDGSVTAQNIQLNPITRGPSATPASALKK